ncbi:MAG: hypothetical protein WBG38_20015 [Nodosilinea sp.]
MPQETPITTLLVPQGAEYKAVCRGLGLLPVAVSQRLQVVPIPVGPRPVTARLSQLPLPPGGCLIMGLGGRLSRRSGVGDVVLGQRCMTVAAGNTAENVQPQPCEQLTTWLQTRLSMATVGTVVTCDRILTTAQDKAAIHSLTQGDVVDMESSAVLVALAAHPVAILRVISDDYDQPLPDITAALGADGDLKPWPLALSFLKRPRAAIHLIRGSLRGLRRLQAVTSQLFLADL